MRITRDIIEMQLRSVSIPQGQCGQKAFEIAGMLFNQKIDPFPDTRCDSLSNALAVISNALANGKLAIIWLDAGAIDPSCRAIHCYFVFQDDPLQSFAIWDTPGTKFYDQACTRDKMSKTIDQCGEIGLHVVPPPC